MKKAIILAALTLMGAFLVSTAAMAYDDLITNDTAAVKAAGGLCGSASLLYLTASKYWDDDSKSQDIKDQKTGKDSDATHFRIPLRVNYGVMDKLTVFGILPIVSINDGTEGESGIGDVWLGAKYGIMPDGLLTVRGALDVPAGDDEKGLGNAGGFGIDIAAMSMKQIDKIGMNGQVGIRYNVEGPEMDFVDPDTGTPYKVKYTPGLGIYFDAEGSYSFAEAITGIVGIEFMSVAKGESKIGSVTVDDEEGSNYLDLNIGACYKLGEKIGLRGDIIYTLSGKMAAQAMGVLLRLGYMVK